MLNNIFSGIFDSSAAVISLSSFLACIGASLIIGLLIALSYTYKNRYTKSFVVTLAVLPAVVCMVILMVNGNVGAGVAVAGAFGLVRFRSVPGNAKEISAVFLSMAVGLAAGMGYLAYAGLFALIIIAVNMLCSRTRFGEAQIPLLDKTLRITIPEDLDYTGVFDDLMEEYTENNQILSVKTTNMGSLFKLTYQIRLKNASKEKEFLDQLRCRNGNLEVSICLAESHVNEL